MALLVPDFSGESLQAVENGDPGGVARQRVCDHVNRMGFAEVVVIEKDGEDALSSSSSIKDDSKIENFHVPDTDALPVDEQDVGLIDLSAVIIDDSECNVASEAEFYVCGRCGRAFKHKSRYDRHINNHPTEKKFPCRICNKSFQRISHLEKHVRTHTNVRDHVCDQCGAAFILSHHLKRHYLLHSGDRPFSCDVCGKQFTRKAGLNQHLVIHAGQKPFHCLASDCDKQFADRTTLRRHMLTHSSEKPFICKECNKTFRTKSACRKHYMRHFRSNKVCKCAICEEMFHTEDQLQMHSVIHEAKQKSGALRCGFCLRVFKTQADLDTHVPAHEDGSRFCCDRCEVKFYSKRDLLFHLQRHDQLVLVDSVVQANPPVPQDVRVNVTVDASGKSNPHILLATCAATSSHTVSTNEVAARTRLSDKIVVLLQFPQSLKDVKIDQAQQDELQRVVDSTQVNGYVQVASSHPDSGDHTPASAGTTLPIGEQHRVHYPHAIENSLSSNGSCSSSTGIADKLFGEQVVQAAASKIGIQTSADFGGNAIKPKSPFVSGESIMICEARGISVYPSAPPNLNSVGSGRGSVGTDLAIPVQVLSGHSNPVSISSLSTGISSDVSPPMEIFMEGDDQESLSSGGSNLQVVRIIDSDGSVLFASAVNIVADNAGFSVSSDMLSQS